MDNPTRNPPIRLSALLAYGAPALPLAALTLPTYILLPKFYAVEVGLGLASVGLILLLARIWDVVSDPVIGQLSDRLETRFGRRRPWIVLGTPLVMIAVWFLFVPGPGAGIAHLLLWSIVLYTGWTMMILPLTAWGAELSPGYNERSRIAAFRETAIILGTLLALGLPVALGIEDGPAAGGSLSLIAWTVVLLLPVTVVALLVFTPEPPIRYRAHLTIRRGLAVLKGNRPFRRLIAAYLLNGIANGLPATMFVLYVANVLQAPKQAAALLFVLFPGRHRRGAGLAEAELPLRQESHLVLGDDLGGGDLRFRAGSGLGRSVVVRGGLRPDRDQPGRRSGAAIVDAGRRCRSRHGGMRRSAHRALFRGCGAW